MTRETPSLRELQRVMRETGTLLRERAQRDAENGVDLLVGIKILQGEGAGQAEIRAYQRLREATS